MKLTPLDWAAIVGYLLITLLLGLYFRRRSGRSTLEYFVSGRKAPWWLAGTSMVGPPHLQPTPRLRSLGSSTLKALRGTGYGGAFSLPG